MQVAAGKGLEGLRTKGALPGGLGQAGVVGLLLFHIMK